MLLCPDKICHLQYSSHTSCRSDAGLLLSHEGGEISDRSGGVLGVVAKRRGNDSALLAPAAGGVRSMSGRV